MCLPAKLQLINSRTQTLPELLCGLTVWVRHITQCKQQSQPIRGTAALWEDEWNLSPSRTTATRVKRELLWNWELICKVPTRLANITGGVWDVLPIPILKRIFTQCLIRTMFWFQGLMFLPWQKLFSKSKSVFSTSPVFTTWVHFVHTFFFTRTLNEVQTLCVLVVIKFWVKKGIKKDASKESQPK